MRNRNTASRFRTSQAPPDMNKTASAPTLALESLRKIGKQQFFDRPNGLAELTPPGRIFVLTLSSFSSIGSAPSQRKTNVATARTRSTGMPVM